MFVILVVRLAKIKTQRCVTRSSRICEMTVSFRYRYKKTYLSIDKMSFFPIGCLIPSEVTQQTVQGSVIFVQLITGKILLLTC